MMGPLYRLIQVLQKYGSDSFLTYFSILAAIPKNWKDTIKHSDCKHDVLLLLNASDILLDDFLRLKKSFKIMLPSFFEKTYNFNIRNRSPK